MKIALSCDHAGFPFKNPVITRLQNLWHEVLNLSPETIEPLDDFPDYAAKVARAVSDGSADRGVLICGTGVGMSIAANRHPWIRAVLLYNSEIAKISRSHNDANIACFGARTMVIEDVLGFLDIFLSEPFIGGKYEKRNDKIDCLC